MNNRFPNRRWCIINSGDATNVNYDQILENAATTLRYSVDGSKTFVKYNVTEYPVIQGYDDDGNVEYNNNVDSNPLYGQNDGGSDVITGSGFHLVDTDNITGSGIAYTSGTVVGRPDIFSSALTVSGKTEFNHPEILGILATEEWTQTGLL
mgnify:CR=1 FL=1